METLIWSSATAAVTSVMSNSVRPHRRQPTRLRRPWDSPGKNTGVGCHFLLQCMKVKSEGEVAQSCPTPSDCMDCSPPGSTIHGIFQAKVLEWGAIAFSDCSTSGLQICGISPSFSQKFSWLGILILRQPSVEVCGLWSWAAWFQISTLPFSGSVTLTS